MKRIDQLVVLKGWASSREKALELIRAGRVLVNGIARLKPSVQADFDSVTLVPDTGRPSYVGRGGEKLEGALAFFGLDPGPGGIVDLGASTGGFTQCLLSHGANKVWAVDVGHSQMDSKLKNDPRVVLLEGVNARWPGEWIPSEPVSGVVADLSFISLRKVTDTVGILLKRGGFFLPLFKPQFEAGPRRVGKGGVVRDPEVVRTLLRDYIAHMSDNGGRIRGIVPSSITGRKGNQEYFLLFQMGSPCEPEREETPI
jgi:23S rRNA (cytidine1920-2'-O)/16S rRNA (cytidine1409-2'-O)-methyltransferase